MFLPINQPISKEEFLDNRNFILGSGQVIRDGRLMLAGTAINDNTPGQNWAFVTWDEAAKFRPIPDATNPTTWRYSEDGNDGSDFPYSPQHRQDYSKFKNSIKRGPRNTQSANFQTIAFGRNPTFGDTDSASDATFSGSLLSLSSGEKYLYLDSSTSDSRHIYQATSEAWGSVSNTAGYTLEFRALVTEGTSELVLDDGTKRLTLGLTKEGIHHNGDKVLGLRWNKQFSKFRIAAQGNCWYAMTENGTYYNGTSELTEASSNLELSLGSSGSTDGTMYLDYVRQYHDGIELDEFNDLVYVVGTSEATAYTPSLYHKRDVSSFVKAFISSVGDYNETTTVQLQYRNTSNPSWQDYSSPLSLVSSRDEIDLSSVPTDNDASDEVRFKIVQVSSLGTVRPPSVSEIVVQTSFTDNYLNLVPEYGPIEGGNSISLLSGGIEFDAADRLFVDGVEISSGDIDHISTSEKLVLMPSGNVGHASFELITPDTSSYFSERGYLYTDGYNRGIDRYQSLSTVAGTRSPFKILNEVPDGQINLAFISTPGLEPASTVSTIDLSYLEGSNVVSGSAEPELLTGAVSDTSSIPSTYTYSSPNTEKIAVAGSVCSWHQLGVPSPAFYKHLIGKGRFYVRSEQETLNKKELRDSIVVHYGDGIPIPLEEYPWDIMVSSTDIDGVQLPQYIYSVVLLLNKKYIPGSSVFVTITVADKSSDWKLVQGYTEVINPVEIVMQGASRQGFSTTVDEEGNFSIEIRD